MSHLSEQSLTLRQDEVRDLAGKNEQKLSDIEERFNAKLVLRGNVLKVIGAEDDVRQAVEMIRELLDLQRKRGTLSNQEFRHAVREAAKPRSRSEDRPQRSPESMDKPLSELLIDGIPVPLKRRALHPLTGGQKRYIDLIRSKDIVFGIGPAGTGKTYLAVAMAVSALISGKVSRIILCRPAVEAGEKLGFLPGDLREKLNPYVRPLYDALYEMMEAEKIHHALETGVIEIAPLAFMRGRTLNNAFVILDEGQNTTPEQMKMFLTRLGFESRAVITGDQTQIDLPSSMVSGLKHVQRVLKHLRDDIGFAYFDETDVVRHELVMKIVRAYERFEGQRGQRDLLEPDDEEE